MKKEVILKILQNKLVKILFVCLTGLIFTIPAFSQESATEGKEFYVAFTSNYYSNNILQIRYAVSKTCRITSQYGDGTYIDNNVEYTPGIYTKTVEKAKCYIESAGLSNLGIKVTSTENIALFAINQQTVSTDATTVLPVTSLSNNYPIISHDPWGSSSYANILVIAPTSGTIFTIRKPDGTVVVNNQSLSARQAYFYRVAGTDLSGYSVESNYSTAVFSSLDCGAQAPDGGCDHNFEQMWPTHTAGKHFFLWNHSINPLSTDQIRILALEDGTVITKKEGLSESTITLNKNSVHRTQLSKNNPYVNNAITPVTLSSNKPIVVNHILGYAPSIKWWSSLEQRVTSTVISPFIITAITKHWLHIMIPAGTEQNMIVRENRNGVVQDVTLTFFTNVTDPNYVIATRQYNSTDEVLIELINPAGFIANMHGTGSTISYIFTAGAGAFNLQSYFTIGTKTMPYNDTYYSATEPETHSFEIGDNITIKRTIEKPFSSVKWLINGVQHSIAENTNINNTLTFPASALVPGGNTLTMSVRFNGAAADSVYTGNVWLLSIKTNDDIAATEINTPIIIDVLDNDIIELCNRGNLQYVSVSDKMNEIPKHGSAVFRSSDTALIYTPYHSWYGMDSLRYTVKDCNAIQDSAWVYILTNKPLSKQYVACPNAVVDLGFASIPNVQYNWYNVETGGTIVAGGTNANRLTVTKNNSAIETWWVEPVWEGITFPRQKVELLKSNNCGVINPVGCAVEGTLLFKEDFGGNNISDPEGSSIPLSSSIIDYAFCTPPYQAHPMCILDEGRYAITKKTVSGTTAWHAGYSDHTYPNDGTRGYMLLCNADNTPGKFYEYKIDDLCANSKLFFSVWLANLCRKEYITGPKEPSLTFEISDLQNNVLATYTTGTIPRTTNAEGLKWTQYGFEFIASANQSVIMRIYNNGEGGEGNDVVIDDIEIRFCASEVEITKPIANDTVVCQGQPMSFKGNYVDNGLLGQNLDYRWEYSITGNNVSTDWTPITGATGSSSNSNVNSEYLITNVSKSNEGYYRLIVAPTGNLDKWNCRAMSRIVYLGIKESRSAYPDIRIQTCPNMGEINLSSYLDTIGLISVEWFTSSPSYPAISNSGKVNSNNFVFPQTYIYSYKIKNYCYDDRNAKVYVKTLANETIGLPPDTVVICWENAETLHLKQILGIEAGGEYITDAVVGNYLKKADLLNIFAGAVFFDGKKAYEDLLSNPAYKYAGDKTTGNAIKVKITYTVNDSNSCLNGKSYVLILILTDELVS